MIERPSKILELLFAELSAEIQESIMAHFETYSYWTDVKYRVGKGISPKIVWGGLKSYRAERRIDLWHDFGVHFSLTGSMQKLCHDFDMNFGGSWGASKIFPSDETEKDLYLISSIMEEAIASSQMEGASTTREFAKDMLRKKSSPKDRSQRMIVNNYNTINFIRSHAQEDLTPALILRVHKIMTEGAIDVEDASGRLRRNEENIVVGNGITGETVHTPPEAECLDGFLEDLCVFFNERNPKVFIHPVIRGITIHYLIAFYHPFADGNGRTARALFYWYLMREGYWLVEYLSISRIIRGSKRAYEKAFECSEMDGNDIGYFISYSLSVLNKAFQALSSYIKRKHSEKSKAESLLHIGGVNVRQAQILTLFVDNPKFVGMASSLAPRFGVTQNTAKNDLKVLTRQGILMEIPIDGKTKGYVRVEDFDTLIGG